MAPLGCTVAVVLTILAPAALGSNQSCDAAGMLQTQSDPRALLSKRVVLSHQNSEKVLKELKEYLDKQNAPEDPTDKHVKATQGAMKAMEKARELMLKCGTTTSDCKGQDVASGIFDVASELSPILPLLSTASGPWAPVIGLFGTLLSGWLGTASKAPEPLTSTMIGNVVEKELVTWASDDALRKIKSYGVNLRKRMLSMSDTLSWENTSFRELSAVIDKDYIGDRPDILAGLTQIQDAYRKLVGTGSEREKLIENRDGRPRLTFASNCNSQCYPGNHQNCAPSAARCSDDLQDLNSSWARLATYVKAFDRYMVQEGLFEDVFVALHAKIRKLDKAEHGGKCIFDCKRNTEPVNCQDCRNKTLNDFFADREFLYHVQDKANEALQTVDLCRRSDPTFALDQFCHGRTGPECNWAGMSGVICFEECHEHCSGWRTMDKMMPSWTCSSSYQKIRKEIPEWGTICGDRKSCIAPGGVENCNGNFCPLWANFRICASPVMCIGQQPRAHYTDNKCGPFNGDDHACHPEKPYCSQWGWCGNESAYKKMEKNRTAEWAARYDWGLPEGYTSCATPFVEMSAWGLASSVPVIDPLGTEK
eukprot:TRINITY_DN105821_c0_g1_i1.p1 TRINITY_DN105821_c0_g1~~TRINITY_DN105821_c0_g1_i1.p1  ORF type:complete len:611 (-),score=84.23 TRINITY_DN105821_c0_g1_i1:402-2177(-)